VHWCNGDALDKKSFSQYLSHTSIDGVVSCVGKLTVRDKVAKEICGDANINVCEESKKQGVTRFVFISARRPKYWLTQKIFQDFLLRGYYQGKAEAEDCVKREFGTNGISLRPGIVTGTRWMLHGMVPLPLYLYDYVLGWFYPYCPAPILARASVGFIAIKDPYIEKVIENKDISQFAML